VRHKSSMNRLIVHAASSKSFPTRRHNSAQMPSVETGP